MQEVDDLISILFHVIGYMKKHHDKVPRSILKFYVYLNNNVRDGNFKEDKLERLYKGCKAALLELVEEGKLAFDNKQKEQEWFAKMEDLEGKINAKNFQEYAKSMLVPINKISPGINTNGLTIINKDSIGPASPFEIAKMEKFGRPLPTHYIEELYDDYTKDKHFRDILEFKLFKNQIVIDLGAGYQYLYGYYIAVNEHAKAYIAVELYFPYHYLGSFLHSKFTDFPVRFVPLSIIPEDMLTFLRRLPSESVSVLASGIDKIIMPNEEYIKQIEKEIVRVLHPKGACITYFSDLMPLIPNKEYTNKYGSIYRLFKK